ncbi:MAG: PRC-barrel domain-containing protein [Alphaproteobacteria bacterium]
MIKGFLTAVSVIAIMGSAPTLADTYNKDDMSGNTSKTETKAHSDGSFTKDAKQAWQNTKEDMSQAAENVSEATKETYKNIKSTLTDDKDATTNSVKINRRMTASGIIGQPVYNKNGDRVAKVEDIILNRNGEAIMVVLVDGEWTGLGKMAAFDYNLMTNRSAQGDVIAPLTEEMITNAASFSYDREDYSNTVKVIPSNGYSMTELLDAQLVNPQGEKMAEIDNISLQNGEAKRLIVEYGDMMGIGGNRVALNYDSVELVPNGRDNELDFELSTAQARYFENFKNTSNQ